MDGWVLRKPIYDVTLCGGYDVTAHGNSFRVMVDGPRLKRNKKPNNGLKVMLSGNVQDITMSGLLPIPFYANQVNVHFIEWPARPETKGRDLRNRLSQNRVAIVETSTQDIGTSQLKLLASLFESTQLVN